MSEDGQSHLGNRQVLVCNTVLICFGEEVQLGTHVYHLKL